MRRFNVVVTSSNTVRIVIAILAVLLPGLPPGAASEPGPERQITFVVGDDGPHPVIRHDPRARALTVEISGDLDLTRVDTENSLVLVLSGDREKTVTIGSITAADVQVSGGHERDRLVLEGPLSTTGSVTVSTGAALTLRGEIDAGSILLHGNTDLSILESTLTAAGELDLSAGGEVRIRDGAHDPVLLISGGDMTLGGHERLDVFALTHPGSALVCAGDLSLRSGNPVRGDVHVSTGGKFRIETIAGCPGDLISPYDPIILAGGDVQLGGYVGASLHILAGGAVILGDVEITGTDGGVSTINPGNANAFNGLDAISNLTAVTLSDGAIVPVDGSVTPTLDVRAGIDWNTFAGGTPVDQVIPAGSVAPIFGAATRADITIGNILVSVPDGQVLLTNQYRTNGLLGNIVTGDIVTATPLPETNAGSVTIDSCGDLTTGLIDARSEATGQDVLVGNGGAVTLLAPAGAVTVQGDLTTFTRVPVNNSGSVGDGGPIQIQAAGAISVDGAAGRVDSSAFANTDDAGNGGTITIRGASFEAERVVSRSFAVGSASHGGAITIEATDGAVTIPTQGFGLASIEAQAIGISSQAGNGGDISISATDGIAASLGIDAGTNGTGSQSGNIDLFTTQGDVTAGFLRTRTSSVSMPGDPGNVTVQAPAGGIATGDVETFCNAFVINNPARPGGNIFFSAGSGDVTTGELSSFSVARGAQGDTGEGGTIDVRAPLGSILVSGSILSYSRSAINNGDSCAAKDGGSVTLEAQLGVVVEGEIDSSSEAQTSSGNGGTATSGGAVTITTVRGSLSVGGNIRSVSSGLEQAGGGGAISLVAKTGLDVGSGAGTLDSSSNSFDGSAGSGGSISLLTHSGDLVLAGVKSSASNTFGAGPAGRGGDIHLTTRQGRIEISGGQFIFFVVDSTASSAETAAGAGDIVLCARHDVVIGGTLRAQGFGSLTDAGNVTLTSRRGSISIQDLRADALENNASTGSGGHVFLDARRGTITAGQIATFADALLIHNDSGNGGDITLRARGDVLTGPLLAYSEARGEFGDTGHAGRVDVVSKRGNILVDGELRADAFSQDNNTNSGNAGDSQGVRLWARENVTVNGPVWTFARSSRFDGTPTPTGNAGNAGPIDVRGEEVTCDHIDARTIAAGSFGAGGEVHIHARKFFRAGGTVFGSDATIDVSGTPGTGGIRIRHGGNGVTPFVVGDPGTNGTLGEILTADAGLLPVRSFLYHHVEAPNIRILSVPDPQSPDDEEDDEDEDD